MKDQRINIKKWHKYAKENRIPKFLANPPIDRVLLKINPQFIPIFFWKPFSIALISGFMFSIVWGVIMYFTLWKETQNFRDIIVNIGLAGAIYGFAMATLHWIVKRRFNNIRWMDFVQKDTSL